VESVSCIFCGDVGTHPYHSENNYQSVSCDGCGLVFVSPRPSEAEMKRLYEGQETKVNLGVQIRYIERATLEAQRALDIIAKFVPTGRLLEIGSSAGYFLRAAQERGYQPVGIDITGPFVQFGRDVLGVDVREGTLASVDLPKKSFDIVYHRNLLSHLASPLESFCTIRELLRPGGWMVYQTGNVAELPGEYWDGTNELDLPDHLYHFAERHIRTLNDRAGFETLDMRRYSLLLHDPWIRDGLSWIRSLLRRDTTIEAGKPKPPFVVPKEVPETRLLATLESLIEGFITYDIGAVLPRANRRATFLVVARARG
jgi:SAM-dependent methyltransferase